METAYAEDVFAHQGGWDEILYAVGPIALIFGLLRLASSRAKRANREKALAESLAEQSTQSEAGSPTAEAPTRD